MSNFLTVFGSYDFLVRDGLVSVLMAFGVLVLLNAGIFAVPQVGFMCVGSYVAAIANTKWSVSLPWTLLLALIAGVIVGIVLGVLTIRLDGIYLAIASIAFSEMVRLIAQNLGITGKLLGITGIQTPVSDLYLLGIPLLVTLVLLAFKRSRHGVAMTAMRSDSLMAAHQGVSIRGYRFALFAASGALCALAGALSVHLTGFIEPGQYTFDALTTVLAATIVGGMTSTLGPWLGVLIIAGLPQVLSGLENYRDVVNGFIIVAVVALAPGGLASLLSRLWSRVVRARRPETLADGRAATGAATPRGPRPKVDHTGQGRVVLAVAELGRAFGGVKALQGVTLDVHAGEVLGIIGPNGSGKSTLLNVLSGVYEPDGGDVVLDGKSLRGRFGAPARIHTAGVARTFQNIRVIPDESVRSNVLLGAHRSRARGLGRLWRRPAGRGPDDTRFDQVIRAFHLIGLEAEKAGSLPYGAQRHVEIARALIRKPVVLLLDEPTAGMTPREREDVFQTIGRVAAEGVGVVVVEHDVEAMLAYCDRLVALDFGRVIASGEPNAVIKSGEVISAYVGQGVGS